MYKQITVTTFGIEKIHIIRDDGNKCFTSFPADENNTDYQAYLKWVSEGNTPLPADE
jgi:hypothetical protein